MNRAAAVAPTGRRALEHSETLAASSGIVDPGQIPRRLLAAGAGATEVALLDEAARSFAQFYRSDAVQRSSTASERSVA